MLENYKLLKKKMLTVIKSHLFRILNKESSFSTNRFNKMKITDVMGIFYPLFIQVKDG